MTFVDMNAIQFYQPPKIAGTRKDRQPAVSSLRPFTALGPSEKKKGTLPNLDQIENLNMIGLPLKEPLNPFHVSASNFSGIEADAGGTVLLPYCLNRRELTLPGISNKLDTTHNYNLSSLIQNNNSISITDLLLNPEEVQEWQGLELTEEPIAANANYSEDGNTKNVQQEAMGQG